eukprot:scaffold111851_cov20-Tisochrysis_lutea.AAC.1
MEKSQRVCTMAKMSTASPSDPAPGSSATVISYHLHRLDHSSPCPSDPAPTGLAYQLLNAGELLALCAGHRGMVMVQVGSHGAGGWPWCRWVVMVQEGGHCASGWSWCRRVVIVQVGGHCAGGWSWRRWVAMVQEGGHGTGGWPWCRALHIFLVTSLPSSMWHLVSPSNQRGIWHAPIWRTDSYPSNYQLLHKCSCRAWSTGLANHADSRVQHFLSPLPQTYGCCCPDAHIHCLCGCGCLDAHMRCHMDGCLDAHMC